MLYFLIDMNLKNLSTILEKEPRFRFKQIQDAVYKQFVDNWGDVSNLPKNLVANLKENYPLKINAEIMSDNGGNTKKAIIRLNDGEQIEAVLMRNKQGKNTACIFTLFIAHQNCLNLLTVIQSYNRFFCISAVITHNLG